MPVARVLWHGAFKDVPYDKHNGIFQAQAFIADTEFSFDPHWPVIKGMQAELLFENAGMLIQSQAGQLFELALENGVSRVEDGAGRFPQVSGISYAFDATAAAGSRVSACSRMS